jgi:anti-sigma regulatory factor (Ser/Thr protein kinase)
MGRASSAFPAGLESVSEARHFLTATLAAWGTDGYDMGAQVVVTELAANAVLHARSAYRVELRLEPTHLVVEVHDAVAALPTRRSPSPDSTTGRGLRLVEGLSLAWGAIAHEDGQGKVVWAHVPPDSLDALTMLFDDVDAPGDTDPARLGMTVTERDESTATAVASAERGASHRALPAVEPR